MAECGVDHIGGVILSTDEWKIPALKESVRVIREAGRKSSIIPLFADPEAVHRVIDWYQPDIIHFCDSLNHGSAVDEEVVRAAMTLQRGVRERFPDVAIMRTIPIAPPGLGAHVPTLELGSMLAAASDWFLTDTLLVEGEDQPEGMLRHGMGGIFRDPDHGQMEPGCRRQIDAVESCAAQRHQTHPQPGEDLERSGIQPVVDEAVHRDGTFRQPGGVGLELRFKPTPLDRSACGSPQEEFPIIGFCGKDGDTHGQTPVGQKATVMSLCRRAENR